ncbi:TIGR04053 family radical SAM/SPASM domain-containing protein [Alicyclobacillaceae bacterium I2511]|nr:TIGR04053 family radical SAM/SPASM domain-containing protein [Alicyclobacillaceae bacterium I2511]
MTIPVAQAPGTVDFHQNPFIVIWEITRACQLHCLHCRAEAQRHRDPSELSKQEGLHLIEQIAAMDHPLLVFTGGDPLEREDLFDFIRYGRQQGLHVAITPSATPRVSREAIARAKEAGLSRWAFSLDGSTAEIHDRFRGTRGSYDLTLNALHILQELQIPIQLNTSLSRYNKDDLGKIADLAETYAAMTWSVFSLVPTGRARQGDMLSAGEHEQVMEWLYRQSLVRPFVIKTTEAPEYRRVQLQHVRERDQGPQAQNSAGVAHAFRTARVFSSDPLRARQGVGDGNGFVFVSHTGEVHPSGFLPVSAGNVRHTPLAEIYRNSPVFQQLRNPNLLKGKCGKCEFRQTCGGSRARAYGVTGDYLESDPSCPYEPGTALFTSSHTTDGK